MRRRLAADLDNVSVLFHRAMARRPPSKGELERGLLALLVVTPVLLWRGPLGVYLQWLDEALAAADDAGVSPPLVAKVAHARATLLVRFHDAVDALEESLALARVHDFGPLRELNELLLACVEAARTGRPEQLAALEGVLQSARERGNNWVVVQAAFYLGRALAALDRRARARELLTESLEIARKDDHRTYVQDCLTLLASLDAADALDS